MPGETHNGRLVTDGVIALLEAASLNVGDAIKPADVEPGETGDGWAIVYPITGGSFDGPIAGALINSDARTPIQVTSNGRNRAQAQWVADKVREALLATSARAAITVADRKVTHITEVFDGGIIRDDDQRPPVFYSPCRFEVWSSPA